MGNIETILNNPLMSVRCTFQSATVHDNTRIDVVLNVLFVFFPLEELLHPNRRPQTILLIAQRNDDSNSTILQQEIDPNVSGYFSTEIGLQDLPLLDILTSKITLYALLEDGTQYFTSSYLFYDYVYQFLEPQPYPEELSVLKSSSLLDRLLEAITTNKK